MTRFFNQIKQLCLFQFHKSFKLQLTFIEQYSCFKLVHFSTKSGRLSPAGPEVLAFGNHCSNFNRFWTALHQTLRVCSYKPRRGNYPGACVTSRSHDNLSSLGNVALGQLPMYLNPLCFYANCYRE